MFGRGAPVWPCAHLVIRLLRAVGSVCGGAPENMPSNLKKELQPCFTCTSILHSLEQYRDELLHNTTPSSTSL